MKLEQKSKSFSEDEQRRGIDISKIEAKLETSKSYLGRYSELAEQLKTRQEKLQQEITSIRRSIEEREGGLKEQMSVCEQLEIKLSSMDLSAFNQKLADLSRREHDIMASVDSITSEIRDLTTELIRSKAELENNLRPGLEHSLQQQSSVEQNLEAKAKFLQETEVRFGELKSIHSKLKGEEAKTMEKSGKFQSSLEELDQRLKTLRTEEESIRKAVSVNERDLVTANLDTTRMQDSERQLLGELAMFGYSEPIETFEGAESLSGELNSEYEQLRGNVNLIADRNYREIFENYKYSSVRKNDLEKERNAIVTFIETIDAEKRRVFMDAFERIDKELRVIFNKITEGSGWLEIENPDAIFDSGIFLMTQFPGKLPRDSSSVSGGEKTISALSFILAIQAVFPSPFYVFDEIDAHLDSRYSGRLADILSERSDRSQIIIVSLKDNVVAKAGSVIGVYMTQGSSKFIRYRSPMEVPINEQQ